MIRFHCDFIIVTFHGNNNKNLKSQKVLECKPKLVYEILLFIVLKI